jgi:predicted TPR repeat methyltransferase
MADGAAAAEKEGRDAVAADPASADAHVALADLLRWLGRPAEAMAMYHNTLLRHRQSADAQAGLAAALRDLGQPESARRQVARTVALAPFHADALCADAALKMDEGDFDAAAVGLLRVLDQAPHAAHLHVNLGQALYRLHLGGSASRVSELARQWLERFPDEPMAQYVGSALLGAVPGPRAPDRYIRETFNLFAASFDAVLGEIRYQVPAGIAAAIDACGFSAASQAAVLDAGCGTGLCAPVLRSCARRLVGVDLSPAMLARARSRALYDELVEAELTAFLSGQRAAYDLIVAADVFCYFGALDRVLLRAAGALSSAGVVAFSVESAAGEADRVRIGAHGRFAHGEAHVRQALESAALQIDVFVSTALRQEADRAVDGFIVAARRRAS